MSLTITAPYKKVRVSSVNAGGMVIPLAPEIATSHPIVSYSWSYFNQFVHENQTATATFSNPSGNTSSWETNITVSGTLGIYPITLSLTNSNGDTASATFTLEIWEGFEGRKKQQWLVYRGGTYSYPYAASDGSEAEDAWQYKTPKVGTIINAPELIWNNAKLYNSQTNSSWYSRVIFDTDARYIMVRASSTWGSGVIGLKINGVVVTGGILFGGGGMDNSVDLGSEGVMKRVELSNGYCGVGAGLPAKQTTMHMLAWSANNTLTFVPPDTDDVIFFMGDSIMSAQEGDHQWNSMSSILRTAPYNLNTILDGGGAVAFVMYQRSAIHRQDLIDAIVRANPVKIWFEYGSNDAFLDNGFATAIEYRDAIISIFGEIHTLLPNTIVYFQTAFRRGGNWGNWTTPQQDPASYDPNNTLGYSLDDYRQVLRDYVAANPTWTRIVEGPDLIPYTQANMPDMLHAFTVGHQVYADAVYPILTQSIVRNVTAGTDRIISLPTTTTTLNGSVVGDGLVSKTWSQISGPNTATIATPNDVTTGLSGLVQGVYTFRLSAVYDNETITDDVLVTVNSASNNIPVVSAGTDETTTASFVTLTATATDGDGTIVSTNWSMVSGPNNPSIGSPSVLITNVSGLVVGTYIFKFSATDNLGAVGEDTKTVTVNEVAPAQHLIFKGFVTQIS